MKLSLKNLIPMKKCLISYRKELDMEVENIWRLKGVLEMYQWKICKQDQLHGIEHAIRIQLTLVCAKGWKRSMKKNCLIECTKMKSQTYMPHVAL